MTGHIRTLLHQVPFHPFEIVTTDGHVFRIPTTDHAHVAPGDFRVVVWDDAGVQHNVSVRHIVRVNEPVDAGG